MDAVRFLKEKNRMCERYSMCKEGCPLKKPADENRRTCIGYCFFYPEEDVAIVENWSAEHPFKTRQSEFLKMFPNAELMNNEIIYMCPKFIDKTYKDDKDCSAIKCDECKKEYWLAEVE